MIHRTHMAYGTHMGNRTHMTYTAHMAHGTHTAHGTIAPLCAQHVRMKLRSPPLPHHLEVTWAYFLEKIPDWLWKRYVGKNISGEVIKNNIGEKLLEHIKRIQDELGEHFKPNPLKPPPEKKAKVGGDPESFNRWVRTMIKENRGKISV